MPVTYRGPTGFRGVLRAPRTRPHPHDRFRAAWGCSVPLLRCSAQTLAQLPADELVRVLTEELALQDGATPEARDVTAWRRGIPALAVILVESGLTGAEVLIGFRLPFSSKRVDAVVCGVDPVTGHDSFVLIETSEWTRIYPVDGAADLCRVPGSGGRAQLTPIARVDGYGRYLRNVAEAFDPGDARLAAAAFLYDAVDAETAWLREAAGDDGDSRLFTAADQPEFIAFLRGLLAAGDGSGAAGRLLSGPHRANRELIEAAAAQIAGRDRFILLDDQQVAHSLVLRAAEAAVARHLKEVVVVTGGPGSGKSAIALGVLGQLHRQGAKVLHATGSRAFTTALRDVAGRGDGRIKALFTYFNNFARASRDGLDVLLCDEAHRMRATSANQYTRADERTGRPQVEELIDAAKVPVFLLDQEQVVRPGEIGTFAAIEQAAAARGLTVRHVALDGQFRNGGSVLYDHWVRRLLGLEPGGAVRWRGHESGFDLQVADTPSALEAELTENSEAGAEARMTAGLCWPWTEPTREGTLVADIRIGGWHRPWNVKGDRRVGSAPKSALWATADGGFGQVGCIYAAQGFEYLWNGVVFGPDLVRRSGRWVAVRAANRDPRLAAKTDDVEFGRLVRNVYRVLLTRGLRGTVLYSTDPETLDFFHSLVDASG